jgi:16S rRNA (cytidine1402-2'-O)-methyltransferase
VTSTTDADDFSFAQPRAQSVRTTGALIVVSTPIGNLGDLSSRAIQSLATADVIACEDTRRTGRLLELGVAPHAGPDYVRPALLSSHAHNERERVREIVERIGKGQRVALVSDAGTPAVSDPGEVIVRAVVDAGLPVDVVPGPSAVLAALVLSGLSAERFAFEGFLPRKGAERSSRLHVLATDTRTHVLYESPQRINKLLDDLIEVCGESREVSVSREITKLHETTVRGTLRTVRETLGESETIGEYVVVLAGAPDVEVEYSDDQLREALIDLVDQGLSKRDASAMVAQRFGVAKRRVYQLTLQDRS